MRGWSNAPTQAPAPSQVRQKPSCDTLAIASANALTMLPIDDDMRRVRAAYRERPNLRVTPSQAQRVFELEPEVCVAVLEALVDEGFLVRTHEGLFVHAADHMKPASPQSLFRRG